MQCPPADALFSRHPAPSWILDGTTGQILAFNVAAEATFGVARADAVHRDVQEVLGRGDPPGGTATPTADWLAPGRHSRLLRGGGGTWETFEVLSVPVEFEGRPAWLQAAHDLGRERRTEEELHRLERRYRDIVETATEGVWIIDDAAVTTFVNETMARMMGYARTEMISRPLTDFMDATGVAVTEKNLERRRRGLTEQHEFCFRRRDGRPLWVSMATHPLHDEAGAYAGALAMVTDISERRQIDHELRLLATSMARLNDMVIITDAALDADTSPRILFVNEAFERRTGYRRADVLGKPLSLLYGPETDRSEAHRIVCAVLGGGPAIGRLLNYTQGGDAFWVETDVVPVADDDGHVTHWVTVQHDVTKQKQQAQRDAARERVLTLMAGGAPMTDVLDSIATGIESILPGTRCAVMLADEPGTTLRVASAPNMPRAFRSAVDGMPIAAEGVCAGQAAKTRQRAVDADIVNDPRWIPYRPAADHADLRSCWSQPVLSRDGGVLGTLDIYRSVPHRPQSPEVTVVVEAARMAAIVVERKVAEDALRQSQKMEALGTLASGIAHDFNNILGAILGNLALATQEECLSPLVDQRLELVKRSALRARMLVQQILAFGRRQPHRAVRQPLQPIVAEALTLIRATLPAAIRLETRIAEELPDAAVDDTQIQQVIVNLCTNAWHALPDTGGMIQVGLNLDGMRSIGPVSADDSDPGPVLHLWVRDNGRGIPEEIQPRIFEPFFSTKPAGAGTGLGLAVVHRIVKDHHGSIVVDSTLGRGTTFHVYLPTASDGRPTTTGAAAPGTAGWAPVAAPEPPRSGRLLLVDDDPVLLMTAQALLQHRGYEVRTAADVPEALAMLRHEAGGFDVVVSDYNMPDATGFDLAREALAMQARLPVLIYSGYIDEAMREEAHRLRVRALIHKERIIEDLAEAVREALG